VRVRRVDPKRQNLGRGQAFLIDKKSDCIRDYPFEPNRITESAKVKIPCLCEKTKGEGITKAPRRKESQFIGIANGIKPYEGG